MQTHTVQSPSSKRAASLVIVFGCMVLGALLMVNIFGVQAQEDDLRINHFHHFGGDVLYCLDGNRSQTTTFFIPGEGGGFQLVDINGQELWFVDEEVVYDAIAAAKANNSTELVAIGLGTYGEVSLYVFIGENDTPYFTFNGFDEYGKPNSMTFRFCNPVLPGTFSGDSDDDDDDDNSFEPQPEVTRESNPVEVES